MLILTNRHDLTADWLILELQRREARFVRFNTEDFPSRCRFSWSGDGDASFELGTRAFRSSEVRSVWYRRPALVTPPADLACDDAAWAAREAKAALDGAIATISARWVSYPDAIRRASSKPLQLRDACRLGFDVADTIVTNDLRELNSLADRSPHGVICKSLTDGQVRSSGTTPALLFTTLIAREQMTDLGPEPQLFQALVPKRYDVRVTVIGEEVFATRIDSQTHPAARVDWRLAEDAALAHSRETLPADVEERCRALVQTYGLKFGAIDLAMRADGGYTFFELNPNGQWAWIEQRTGVPLRAHLADLLTSPSRA